MIGIPASGKSTWIKQQNFKAVVVSTDNIIDRIAEHQGKTYSEVFESSIKQATSEMNACINNAVSNQEDIIWDQTNISTGVRAKKLAQIPKNYKKIAVFFPTPGPEELFARLSSRSSKNIPNVVIENMIAKLVPPSKIEGFDEIIVVKNTKSD